MEIISAFDMLKIGIGPSSSHTLGPWKAANLFVNYALDKFEDIDSINIDLFGSLSLTGKGHATDLAVSLGLSGMEPQNVDNEWLNTNINKLKEIKVIKLKSGKPLLFDLKTNIIFHKYFLKEHPNALKFTAFNKDKEFSKTFYSTGGGFITEEGFQPSKSKKNTIPFPILSGDELLKHASEKPIWKVVMDNEISLRSETEVNNKLKEIWDTMLNSILLGCKTEGFLPGGLNVKRRAFDIYKSLNGPSLNLDNEKWIAEMRGTDNSFKSIINWTSCFALAVNEVNASMGKIVTAPTNGSAGVIPAVLAYYLIFENKEANFEHIKRFLLVAAEIGSIFKKGSTISAAMGGCQAEIGVSSAMAAAALAELLGASPAQVLTAAEIAMEHHLGLTCDPVGGLVQIPCIERNAMGAIKAINAAELAIKTKPEETKVSLDKVISTMWNTALDMNSKYKETSEGGLAIQVSSVDC